MSIRAVLGMSPQRAAGYVSRLVIASAGALLLALLIGLDAPYWAASTPLIVAFPDPGASVRKIGGRFVGTTVGAGVGAAALSWNADPALILALLALWLGLCTTVARILAPGPLSYGAVLAGYTCLVIVMHARSGEAPIGEALDRALAVWLGLVVYLAVLLIGWLIRRPPPSTPSPGRRERLARTWWIGAAEGVRASVIVALAGIPWVLSGGSFAAIFVQVAGIVISLYATRERLVAIGVRFCVAMVVCGAVGYVYLLGPLSLESPPLLLTASLLPVFIACAVGNLIPSLERIVGPFNFLFLQILQIGSPSPSLATFSGTWIACLLGAAAATGAYACFDTQRIGRRRQTRGSGESERAQRQPELG